MQRVVTGQLCMGLILVCLAGCQQQASDTQDIQVELILKPSPPKVGDADLQLQLTDSSGGVLRGAQVRVEGNMNHAGMKPSFASLQEVEPGRYTGRLTFTMGGDWFLLVTARTRDGRTIERKIDVPRVKGE